jgi:hypothetical protein
MVAVPQPLAGPDLLTAPPRRTPHVFDRDLDRVATLREDQNLCGLPGTPRFSARRSADLVIVWGPYGGTRQQESDSRSGSPWLVAPGPGNGCHGPAITFPGLRLQARRAGARLQPLVRRCAVTPRLGVLERAARDSPCHRPSPGRYECGWSRVRRRALVRSRPRIGCSMGGIAVPRPRCAYSTTMARRVAPAAPVGLCPRRPR